MDCEGRSHAWARIYESNSDVHTDPSSVSTRLDEKTSVPLVLSPQSAIAHDHPRTRFPPSSHVTAPGLPSTARCAPSTAAGCRTSRRLPPGGAPLSSVGARPRSPHEGGGGEIETTQIVVLLLSPRHEPETAAAAARNQPAQISTPRRLDPRGEPENAAAEASQRQPPPLIHHASAGPPSIDRDTSLYRFRNYRCRPTVREREEAVELQRVHERIRPAHKAHSPPCHRTRMKTALAAVASPSPSCCDRVPTERGRGRRSGDMCSARMEQVVIGPIGPARRAVPLPMRMKWCASRLRASTVSLLPGSKCRR